jgi:tetratricopeptide (TPR) repeat protein
MSLRGSIRNGAIAIAIALVAAVAAAMAPSSPSSRAKARPSDYDDALAELGRRIDTAERFADAQPESWLRRGEVAALYLGRARLGGSIDDYERAEDEIARAFTHARDGSGPLLVRASLHASLHRFDAARADLERIRPHAFHPPETMAEVKGLLGDVALEQGRYDDARAAYEQALALHRSSDSVSRLAAYHATTGAGDRAAELYREALTLLTPADRHPRATIHLRLGELARDRDDLDAARHEYEAASASFSGSPAVEQHFAELDALEGRLGAAIARYEAIARTGSPEAMDAAAGLLLRSADRSAADAWLDRAEREYERRLARFPEATAGHAVDHFLLRRDYDRALELADRDVALRPGGRARTKRAEVLRAAGRLDEARDEVLAIRETPFRSRALLSLPPPAQRD